MILCKYTWWGGSPSSSALVPAMSANSQDGFLASSTNDAIGYQPYMAFDGNDATLWYSNTSSVPQSLQITLPTTKTITSVRYKVGYLHNTGTGNHKGKVQLLVNGDWQDIDSFDFPVASSPQEFTVNVPAVQASAARVYYTDGPAYNEGSYKLKGVYTLQLYGY